ncbi:MAG: hypothetical protein KDD44_02590 [Bdellovibrionales bacterium]|nr:hypothetical protein [Bdellovibrionales bacterium]
MRPHCHRIVLTLAIVGLSACSTTTLTNQWEDPRYHGGGFQKVAVVALSKEGTQRRIFEDAMVGVLEQRGVEAVPSYEFIGDRKHLSIDRLANLLRHQQSDAILATRLVDVEEEIEYYSPPTYPYRYFYDDFNAYYTQGWPPEANIASYTTVQLETNLYSAKSGKLIWSARSKTIEPGPTEEMVESVGEAVVGELLHDELLEKSQQRSARSGSRLLPDRPLERVRGKS